MQPYVGKYSSSPRYFGYAVVGYYSKIKEDLLMIIEDSYDLIDYDYDTLIEIVKESDYIKVSNYINVYNYLFDAFPSHIPPKISPLK